MRATSLSILFASVATTASVQLFFGVSLFSCGFLSPYHQATAAFVPTSSISVVTNRLNMATAASFVQSHAHFKAEIKVGDTLPNIKLTELVTGAETPLEVELNDLVQGRKVAIFGVPGAFTPGCSKSHLPSFITAKEELKAKGVEEIICVATNDPFVMEAWGRTSGGADAGIRFISDVNGELTEAMGLTLETPAMKRTKRFSLIAENGVVTHYFSSAEQSSDTWAPNVLAAL